MNQPTPDHSQKNSRVEMVNCSFNYSQEQLNEYRRYKADLQTYYNGSWQQVYIYPTIGVCLWIALANLAFSTAVVWHLWKSTLPYRLYTFLLSLSLSDCLAGIATTVLLTLSAVTPTMNTDVQIVLVVSFQLLFAMSLTTYTSLALAQVVAVMRPITFHQHFTAKKAISFVLLNGGIR